MKNSAMQRIQVLANSIKYLPPGRGVEDIVKLTVAVHAPDSDAIDWEAEPVDSHTYVIAHNTRWLVELDDHGCLTVSPAEPDSP